MLLVEYVLNKIRLVDYFNYNSIGETNRPSLNMGGIRRNALSVFLEGQGSPAEQCALMVYLLRQAGVPAAYVVPEPGKTMLLDSTASNLFGIQLRNAKDVNGYSVAPKLIPTNFPWVAVYVQEKWVHVFPWLKDVEVIEGDDLYQYMPEAYDSAYKWIYNYINGDPYISSLSKRSATPGELLPRFIEKAMVDSGVGKSVEDFGIRTRARQHKYAEWDDLPLPFAVGQSGNVYKYLNEIPHIFDTVSLAVWCQRGEGYEMESELIFTTPEIRACDLHNRQLTIRTTGNESNYSAVLSLEASGTSNSTGSFDGDDLSGKQVLLAPISMGSDATLRISVASSSHRRLPEAFIQSREFDDVGPVGWGSLLMSPYSVASIDCPVGSLAAICYSTGRVTSAMIGVHVQKYEKWIQSVKESPMLSVPADIYDGLPIYLMGLNWIKEDGEFLELNQQLHKVRKLGFPVLCLAILDAERDESGKVINEDALTFTQPGFNIQGLYSGRIFNNSMRPDLDKNLYMASYNFEIFRNVNASALEHEVINRFFQQKYAFSAVRLLQVAADSVGGGRLSTDRIDAY